MKSLLDQTFDLNWKSPNPNQITSKHQPEHNPTHIRPNNLFVRRKSIWSKNKICVIGDFLRCNNLFISVDIYIYFLSFVFKRFHKMQSSWKVLPYLLSLVWNINMRTNVRQCRLALFLGQATYASPCSVRSGQQMQESRQVQRHTSLLLKLQSSTQFDIHEYLYRPRQD